VNVRRLLVDISSLFSVTSHFDRNYSSGGPAQDLHGSKLRISIECFSPVMNDD
jgi:hypothetical protein